MRSFTLLLLSAPLALARPSLFRRAYASLATTLLPNLQQEWNASNAASSVQKPADSNSAYTCIGPKVSDFPKSDQWLPFDTLWEINAPRITTANKGSSTYNTVIKVSIQNVAAASKMDARLILVLMMQESVGELTVPCTPQCGLLQHGGAASFDEANAEASIYGMIKDGIFGTAASPGFLTYFNGQAADLSWLNAGEFWRGNPYAASHIYNVGSIESEDLTVGGPGLPGVNTYAHDILSRLQGWNGMHAGCVKSQQCLGLGFSSRPCWK